MSFKALGLSNNILKAIAKKGYTTPSVIQQKAIPVVLQGRDVLASAQTGTGKTAGFTLPLLDILARKTSKKRAIRALIITPTRELAAQIQDNTQAYSQFLELRSTVIFGGVNAKPQITTLAKGVDVLVATPGRLLDLQRQKALCLKSVEILVLDEADRMLDMGFLPDVKRVLQLVPKKRQTLLFSATFSKEIKQLAASMLQDPVAVEAAPENTTAEKVVQKVYKVNKTEKTALLISLIQEGDWSQVLIFTRTKHGANRLSEKLQKNNISAAAIHGNKSQNARTRALQGFKDGSIRVLVATDIAARGLDIPLLPHVINFELPNIPEDYVHRIGRTGRAGASGEAISLVAAEELAYLKGIEKLLQEKLPVQFKEGFILDTSNSVEKPVHRPKTKPARKTQNSRNTTAKKTASKKPFFRKKKTKS